MSTSLAKLDFPLNLTESATSKFLIDNSSGFSMKPFTLSSSAVPGVVEGSRLPQQTAVILSSASFAFFASSASSISNRQSAELEIGLSHRKQRTENFLIAKFRPIMRQLHCFGPIAVCSRLSTVDSRLPVLIANETHSREESSYCKRSTYNFLIANEFHGSAHRQSTTSFASLASFASSASPHHLFRDLRYNISVEENCNPKGDKK